MKAASFRLEMGDSGVTGEARDTWGRGERVGRVRKGGWEIRGSRLRRGWYVESPQILTGSFRANKKNGCRVSRGKDRE